jgi:quinol monooxygenase YgiN
MRPKPEHREVARTAMMDIAINTRREPGCVDFVVHTDLDAEGDLCLYEVWDDDEAIRTHAAKPYVRALARRCEDWLAIPPISTRLCRLG